MDIIDNIDSAAVIPTEATTLSTALDVVIKQNLENTERIMKNAIGYLVSNDDMGYPAFSTFDNQQSLAMIQLIVNVLLKLARSAVRDLDPFNDLTYMRIATKRFEYLVAPDPDGHFTIIVVQ